MSIDAEVLTTDVTGDDKQGIIYLIPRTPKNPAGQKKLFVDKFDGWFPPIGAELWGGSSEIMMGETKIYRRISPTHVIRVKTNGK